MWHTRILFSCSIFFHVDYNLPTGTTLMEKPRSTTVISMIINSSSMQTLILIRYKSDYLLLCLKYFKVPPASSVKNVFLWFSHSLSNYLSRTYYMVGPVLGPGTHWYRGPPRLLTPWRSRLSQDSHHINISYSFLSALVHLISTSTTSLWLLWPAQRPWKKPCSFTHLGHCP